MPKYFKIAGIVLISIFTLFSFAFCEESFTITTYYPSPYGSYNELQLSPHATPVTSCTDTNKGYMYYDSDDNTVYVCKGAALGWQSMASISGITLGWGQLITCTGSNPGVGNPVAPVTCSSYLQAGSYCASPWWNRTCSCTTGTMVITGCYARYDASSNTTWNDCYVTCRMP